LTTDIEESTKSFLADLRQRAGRPLKIRLNNNRSTMLNVQWKQGYTSVSLHRLFVGAPGDVIESLAGYLRGDERKLAPAIKAYIEQQIAGLDYSSRIDKNCLRPVGVEHDLQEIFDQVNRDYFDEKLSLLITWHGAARQRFQKSITFGKYDDVMKLIKIHRILDHKVIPRFVVEFVVYHEMLHHVCRPYVDGKGINRIHHPLFRAREKEHRHYGAAEEWIRHNKEALFQGLMWKDSDHGWT
jgi:hypothetical protein